MLEWDLEWYLWNGAVTTKKIELPSPKFIYQGALMVDNYHKSWMLILEMTMTTVWLGDIEQQT